MSVLYINIIDYYCLPLQFNEIQQLDRIEFVRGRTVELLLVRGTASNRRDGHLEKCLQHQRVLHIHHQRDDRAGQRNAKVYIILLYTYIYNI